MQRSAILLVDDVPSNLDLLEAVLAPLDCDLVRAESGAQALELLSEQEFALIILDVRMPGMDGHEVTRISRSDPTTNSTPIILVTAGEPSEPSELRAYESGAVDFIHKPINWRLLRSKARVFLELNDARRRLSEAQLEAVELRLQRDAAAAREILLERLERKNEDLERANAELSDFAYAAAHDLRTPVRNVYNIADWLGSDYRHQLDDRAQQCVDLLLQSTRQMDAQLQGLLAQAVAGSRGPAEDLVNVDEIVDEIVDELGNAAQLSVRVPRPLPSVRFVRTDLRQIFRSLIDNAIRHNDKASLIVEVVGKAEGEETCFEVSDNGPGVPREERETVFRMFRRLSSETPGAGIGLSLVKKIVLSAGGHVSIDSSHLGGCSVTVSLPTRAEESPVRESTESRPDRSG